MSRTISLAVLGLMLALPMAASAGTPVDSKASDVVTVAAVNTPPEASARDAKPSAPAVERETQKNAEVRGARSSDPGLRFNNPYAFPVQAIPVAFPVVNTFGY